MRRLKINYPHLTRYNLYVIFICMMKSYKSIKSRFLKDKTIRKAYEDLRSEFALVEMLIEKRLKSGFTQAELARKVGTKQSAIARLESGTSNPTVAFLEKIAKALDAKLVIVLS